MLMRDLIGRTLTHLIDRDRCLCHYGMGRVCGWIDAWLWRSGYWGKRP